MQWENRSVTAAGDLKNIAKVPGVADLEENPEVDGPKTLDRDRCMGIDLRDVVAKEKVFHASSE